MRQLIRKEVDGVNITLTQMEQVKRLTIIPDKLYEEDEEVTSTMKVKRKFVNEAFKDIIEKMFQASEIFCKTTLVCGSLASKHY